MNRKEMINYDISKKLPYPFIRECTLRVYRSKRLYNRTT